MLSSVSELCTEVREAKPGPKVALCTKYGLEICTRVFGFHRRTTAAAVHESGEKQGDHLYLSGAPHAHLPFAPHHPAATEESPGKSGKDDSLRVT